MLKDQCLYYGPISLSITLTLLIANFIFCREVFADFDPAAVSKLNEKKIMAPGSTASSLLSELKLRAIIENARQISKVHIFLVMLFRSKLLKMPISKVHAYAGSELLFGRCRYFILLP